MDCQKSRAISPAEPLSIPEGRSSRAAAGLTLIEVTLVVSVLLGLIAVVFIGMSAYNRGADRAKCILNIATVQKAIRTYSNLRGNKPGDDITDLKAQIIGSGKFIEIEPECPEDGEYTYGGDTVPDAGTAYLSCSVGEHVPKSTAGW
ncbi:MAG: type II secretion system protein [Verrucomicrobiae bacterium]|nr:type II secretion system protein [Verrucomicrobiae bacterium]MCP5550428.1 type II secretion system protein [Akkermansiaceae bacterium]